LQKDICVDDHIIFHFDHLLEFWVVPCAKQEKPAVFNATILIRQTNLFKNLDKILSK
jgi:hypothetical protein